MATTTINYGVYTPLDTAALQSLANAPADPFAGWRSERVSNVVTKAMDYEVTVDLSTAATAPNNDKAAYAFIIPWMTSDNGTTWIPGGNFGTTTTPPGTAGTATLSEPNSMRFAVSLPYKTTSQRMQGSFSVAAACGFMPDGFSVVVRNCSGAALGTGCVVAHRAIKYDVA